MERIENIYEVTQRLCGMIDPVGETNCDEVRYKNLEDTINVVELLIGDISKVSKNYDRHEHSISKAGNRAKVFMDSLKLL